LFNSLGALFAQLVGQFGFAAERIGHEGDVALGLQVWERNFKGG